MQKLFIPSIILLLSISILSCSSFTENKATSIVTDSVSLLASKANFNDTLNGKQIKLFYLKNKDIEAAITNYGGRLVNLIVPDKAGMMTDIVIGFDSFKGFYHSKEHYFGATVGRYGNRIAKGKFVLDGTTYTLPLNNGPNTLHGGPGGFHNQVWDAKQISDSSLQLSYFSKDGEMGFPGNLNVKVVYTLTSNREMKIEYQATTDKKTVINLTNHTFFNLNGGGTIINHIFMINASQYTPVDSTMIPLGENETVEGSPFDFRKPATIGERINDKNIQLTSGKGYDHNFVIDGEIGAMKKLAEVKGDKKGITMEIFSNEPGLQFYSGNFMKSNNILKNDTKDDYRTAFALEPQHYPDSPNQSRFPSTVLDSGKVYTTVSIYKFNN